MWDRLFALLIHDSSHPLESLKSVLRDLMVDTYSVRTCEEASSLLNQTHPHIIFTDTALPDGSWADILSLAAKADVPVNVIVVGNATNTRLYVSALERGAFDFVAPPFEREDLARVVGSAERDIRSRREALARAQAA